MIIKSECKFIAVKKFSITDISNNIHVIPEGAIIMAEPIEGEKELAEITIMVSNIICDIFKAELNDFFPFCVKSYNGESKSESSSIISANHPRHVQIKVCETEDEANEFLADRPDTDIISVTPTVVELGQYADVHFHIVYKTDL
jgi:hypothetical protein